MGYQERYNMPDMTLKQAEGIVGSLGPDVTLDEVEDYGFAVLKAVSVIKKDLAEREKLYG